jgi:hypothetical protein
MPVRSLELDTAVVQDPRHEESLQPNAAPQRANAELEQLHVRVIALENLVITLLADPASHLIERRFVQRPACCISSSAPRFSKSQTPANHTGLTQVLEPARIHHTRNPMPYRIAILLFMLWLLGLVYSYTMNGFIHALPAVALVIAWMQYIRKHPAA